jgi:hypothetical protein
MIVAASATLVQSAHALNVEDFESYANTAALEAKWQDTVGSPVQTLDTTEFHGGANSMKLAYNCGPTPFENQLTYSFASNQDWSAFNQLNIWIRSVDGATSLENLTFQLKDEFGGTLGGAVIDTQIGNAWTEWSIDLSGFSGLSGVRKMSFDVSAFDVVNGYGAGTLYIDDISVVAPIPEPGTMSLMLLGGLGMVVALKRSRRKDGKTAA